jgi:hypothetical protein
MNLFLSNRIYAQLLPDKRGWTVADSGSSSLDQKSGNPTEIAGFRARQLAHCRHNCFVQCVGGCLYAGAPWKRGGSHHQELSV